MGTVQLHKTVYLNLFPFRKVIRILGQMKSESLASAIMHSIHHFCTATLAVKIPYHQFSAKIISDYPFLKKSLLSQQNSKNAVAVCNTICRSIGIQIICSFGKYWNVFSERDKSVSALFCFKLACRNQNC